MIRIIVKLNTTNEAVVQQIQRVIAQLVVSLPEVEGIEIEHDD